MVTKRKEYGINIVKGDITNRVHFIDNNFGMIFNQSDYYMKKYT